MDTETLQPLQTNHQQENQKLLTPDIKIRKKGRPKTKPEKDETEKRKPGRPKIIEDMKQYQKERYEKQKDKIKEANIECAKRYRDAYKLLIKMVKENLNPDDIKVEAIKIISV